ncbi:uncharacterized protein L969DRAFT_42458 [Mixia osmundae IAM 14324]|uniref:Uncharacterized protein n=1 Tax=Mixia osmundae (strain CBS 9802 / IAM 14324 / JCM 22182 / KY 12970) TaxID=764103 RepID=G7DTP2_MIXOS|nr:uncharacterized protein L969DRAFT_42458 [Mixia osmundae IAM 14324]KEI42777.1 hypothetical protein L969DRAFT_42458 [Mixia osmundae IAM 14324]GAA93889.1 hypothetical protein E5Q_00535 [Mixia osmundae IAM 14324]
MQAQDLQVAQHHLEAACAASDNVRDRQARILGESKILEWKTTVGKGANAIQAAQHILQHSRSQTALFHACLLLQSALPHCLLSQLLPIDTIWELRTWLIQYAIGSRAQGSRRLGFIGRQVIEIIAAVTRAGFALDTHASSGASGWSNEHRHQVAAQLEQLLSSPDAAAGLTADHLYHHEVGMSLAASFVNHFDELDAFGNRKRRKLTDELSWKESDIAKQTYQDALHPLSLRLTLDLLDHAAATSSEDTIGLFTGLMSTLEALISFNFVASGHSSSDTEALPGTFNSTFESIDDADEAAGTSVPQARTVPSPARETLLDPATFILLARIRSHLANLTTDRPDDDDLQTAESDCRICLEYLIALSAHDWQQKEWKRTVASVLVGITMSLPDPAALNVTSSGLLSTLFSLSRWYRVLVATTPLEVLLEALSPPYEPGEPEITFATFLICLQKVSSLSLQATQPVVVTADQEMGAQAAVDAWDESEKLGLEAFQEAAQTYTHLASLADAAWPDLNPHDHPPYANGNGVHVQQHPHATLFAQINDGCLLPLHFLQAKLTNASQRSDLLARMDDADEVEDEEAKVGVKDRRLFRDHLLVLANLGRRAPEKLAGSLNQLVSALSARTLNLIHRVPSASETGADIDERERQLEIAFEHLHWAILIATLWLADDIRGETPAAPISLIALSARVQNIEEDPIVQIPRSLLNLLRGLTDEDANSLVATRCSPQIQEDLFWFLGIFAPSYVLTDPTYTGPLSSSLEATFGGPAGSEVLDFALHGMTIALVQWTADADVLGQVGKTLSAFSRSRGLSSHAVASPAFSRYINTVLARSSILPEDAVGAFFSSALSIDAAARSASYHGDFFWQISGGIENRLRDLVRTTSAESVIDPAMLIQIQTSLEICTSLLLTAQPATVPAIAQACGQICPIVTELMLLRRQQWEIAGSVLAFFRALASMLALDMSAEALPGLHSLVAYLDTANEALLESFQSYAPSDRRELLRSLLLIESSLLEFASTSSSARQIAERTICSGIERLALRTSKDYRAESSWLRVFSQCLQILPEQLIGLCATASMARITMAGTLERSLGSSKSDAVNTALDTLAQLSSVPGDIGQLVELVSSAAIEILNMLLLLPFAIDLLFPLAETLRCLLSRLAATGQLDRTIAAFRDQCGITNASERQLVDLTLRDIVHMLLAEGVTVADRFGKGQSRPRLVKEARDELIASLRECRLTVSRR